MSRATHSGSRHRWELARSSKSFRERSARYRNRKNGRSAFEPRLNIHRRQATPERQVPEEHIERRGQDMMTLGPYGSAATQPSARNRRNHHADQCQARIVRPRGSTLAPGAETIHPIGRPKGEQPVPPGGRQRIPSAPISVRPIRRVQTAATIEGLPSQPGDVQGDSADQGDHEADQKNGPDGTPGPAEAQKNLTSEPRIDAFVAGASERCRIRWISGAFE